MSHERNNPLQVLIIESDSADERMVRSLVSEIAGIEFSFKVVRTLEDGLDQLTSEDFSLILLGGDVTETPVLHALARVARWARFVPIIVLTREDDEAQARAVVRLGAQNSLTKANLTSAALSRSILLAIERATFVREMAREWQMFHALLDYTPDRIYFKDLEGRFLKISRSEADLFRIKSPSEAVGRTALDFFAHDFAERIQEDERRIMQTGQAEKGKVERVELPDGRVVWVSVSKLPLRDERGRTIGIIGISRTITELKLMEEALAEERNLLRNVIDHLPDYIFVKDLQGRYTLSNVMHMRRCGAQMPEQLLGKTAFDFLPPDEAKMFEEMDADVVRTSRAIVNREVGIVDSGGDKKWLLTTKVPLRGAGGGVQAVVCIERDITGQKINEQRLVQVNADLFAALADLKNTHEELRTLQMQLIEAEKMKSIGRLAAGIAHEVKNPLAVIRMGADFLSKNLVPADAMVGEVVKEMLQSVERADTVIKGLLDYSAPRDLEIVEADLNEIARNALTLVRGEMAEGKFSVVLELMEDLPRVRVDPLKISQVVVNLLTNAIQAMENGGTITVRTRMRQITGVGPNIGDVRSEAFHAGDRVAMLEVEDTGPGIPPDKLQKLFDPFFTTKPTGKGTGLGLTVAKSIIDLHGGTIEVTNKTDGGAHMTVTLKI